LGPATDGLKVDFVAYSEATYSGGIFSIGVVFIQWTVDTEDTEYWSTEAMPPFSAGQASGCAAPSTYRSKLVALTALIFFSAHSQLVHAQSVRNPHLNNAAEPLGSTLLSPPSVKTVTTSTIISSAGVSNATKSSVNTFSSSTKIKTLAVRPTIAQHSANGIESFNMNLQTFDAALGRIQAPSITLSQAQDQPFLVEDKTFADFASAGAYACDLQMTGCQQAAGQSKKKGNAKDAVAFSAADCTSQKAQCNAAQTTAPFQTFIMEDMGPDPLDSDWELLCAP